MMRLILNVDHKKQEASVLWTGTIISGALSCHLQCPTRLRPPFWGSPGFGQQLWLRSLWTATSTTSPRSEDASGWLQPQAVKSPPAIQSFQLRPWTLCSRDKRQAIPMVLDPTSSPTESMSIIKWLNWTSKKFWGDLLYFSSDQNSTRST